MRNGKGLWSMLRKRFYKWLSTNGKIWKQQKKPMPHELKNAISDSKTTGLLLWIDVVHQSPAAWVNWKCVNHNNCFYWGYSYFSTSIKVIKTGNLFLFLAETLFCYNLKLLSGKTMEWDVLAAHSTNFHTYLSNTGATNKADYCGIVICNRVKDSMFQGASAALKTAFTHTVWPVVWLHFCVTDQDGLKLIIIIQKHPKTL